MALKIAEIYVLTPQNEPILKKIYRKGLKLNCVEVYGEKRQNEKDDLLPYFKEDGVFFYYIQRHKITFLATSSCETSPLAVIELLSRIYHIFKDFCGTVSENSIKRNLLLLYEVLDEIMDYGCVQLASTDKLKPYVSSEPVMTDTSRSSQEDVAARLLGIDNRVVPFTAANKPVIRSKSDLETRRNEIFVDVVERLTAVVDSAGNASRLEINGSVNMKFFLIGSPQIKIALNEDMVINKDEQSKGFGQHVQLDRCRFHQCVKLDEFESERLLKVYPSTGEFAVMTYSASGEIPVTLPVKVVTSMADIKGSRDVDVTVRVKCAIPANCHAVYITVKIKVPNTVTSMSQSLGGANQTASLNRDTSFIYWTIKKLVGDSETSGKFRLICQGGERLNKKEIGPLIVDFEVSGYTSTGLHIRYMRVYDQDHSYVPFRWIRYITVSESYVVKI